MTRQIFFRLMSLWALTILSATTLMAEARAIQLNDQEYFEARGVNVLVFSNWYNGMFDDSKISGIELIHHGVRTATNGDVRLHATPEQWDAIPEFVERKADPDSQTVSATLRYPEHGFEYSIRVKAEGESLRITVTLPAALPAALVGRAGLNLEFLPAAYFGRSFMMDGETGLIPLYPTGPKETENGTRPVPLASGRQLAMAPGDPQRRITIESTNTDLALYDGRSKAQNGWFVVQSLLPGNKTGDVLSWTLTANSVPDWIRPPVIAHSQVGYHPAQKKAAVIEQDRNSHGAGLAAIYRLAADGTEEKVLDAAPEPWGQYKRYEYLTFDFSAVQEEGLYVIRYADQRTSPFRVARDIYNGVWHPTLDIFFPVQMDHMTVNEAYRVWHGASHLDDARQAPVNHQHFDLYAQGPTTDTPYQPGEHIPGLNIGGWYDAGDYDIRTQTQYGVVRNLVTVWENFRPLRDNTTVDYPSRFVDIHVPDGKPDILQQIEHGALALVAQYRAVGHAIPGIIVPSLEQYTHLGDGVTMTDNLVYDPELGELESDGIRSGKPDDRWAFTSRSSALNFGSIAALAAASRALSGYNDSLAEECLETAVRAWEEERSRTPDLFRHGNTTGGALPLEETNAALELLIATGKPQYAERILHYLPEFENQFHLFAVPAVRALPYLDSAYASRVRSMAEIHLKRSAETLSRNPYGVMITEGGWAGNGAVIGGAITNYYLHKAYPDLFESEDVLRGVNYILGTHPASNLSFVSGVGARSKKVAYGMNRADFSFIAGGIVPGVLMLKPDFPENKEDWPFLWGQNEYVISLGATWLFLAHAADELVSAMD